jgi:hypothetical protein
LAGGQNPIARIAASGKGKIHLSKTQLQRNSFVLPLLPSASVSLQSLSTVEFEQVSDLVAAHTSLFYGKPEEYLKSILASLVSSGAHAQIFTFLVNPSAETYGNMLDGIAAWDKPRFQHFALRVCNSDGYTVYSSDSSNNAYANVKDIPNNTRDSSGNYLIFQPMAEQSYVMAAFLKESGKSFNSLIYDNFNHKSYGMGAKYNNQLDGKVLLYAIRQGSLNHLDASFFEYTNEEKKFKQ